MRTFSTLFLLCLLSLPHTVNAACGERGGPAFRGPDGKCVGWARLDSVCGHPPTTRCTYEGGGVGDTGQDKGKAFIAGMLPSFGPKSPGPQANFHVRKTKAQGIACTSQLAIARVAEACTSRVDGPDCKALSGGSDHLGAMRETAGRDRGGHRGRLPLVRLAAISR